MPCAHCETNPSVSQLSYDSLCASKCCAAFSRLLMFSYLMRRASHPARHVKLLLGGRDCARPLTIKTVTLHKFTRVADKVDGRTDELSHLFSVDALVSLGHRKTVTVRL